MRDAWNSVSSETVKKSIAIAGFDADHDKWHIAKHDVYGEKFLAAWNDRGEREVDGDAFDDHDTLDDIDIIDNCLDDLVLDSDE